MVDFSNDAPPNPSDSREEVVAILEEFVANAFYMAELAVEYLSTTGMSPTATKPSSPAADYPADWLLEVGAIARLRHWEQVGLKDAIDSSLPSSEQAMSDLNERFQDQSHQVTKVEPPLSRQVVWAWWSYCARGSREDLGVDVVVRQPSQDELIDCLAPLLWQFRHLSNREEKTNGKTQEK